MLLPSLLQHDERVIEVRGSGLRQDLVGRSLRHQPPSVEESDHVTAQRLLHEMRRYDQRDALIGADSHPERAKFWPPSAASETFDKPHRKEVANPHR